uniref:Uncharacterized protein n=1 Tax=Parascaris univalens TaxID=6257 RepID=A0A915A908_PARUN
MIVPLLFVVLLLNVITAEEDAKLGPCVNNICPNGYTCQEGYCVVSEEATDHIEEKSVAEPVDVHQE